MINLVMTTRQPRASATERFLVSLNEQTDKTKNLIRLIAVIQSEENLCIDPDVKDIKVVHVKPCSLSKARNEGIKLIPEGESGIIAFPDDDCWYNSTVLSAAVKNLEQYDFVSMGIYDPIKRKGFGKHRTLNEKCEINEDNVLLKPYFTSLMKRMKSHCSTKSSALVQTGAAAKKPTFYFSFFSTVKKDSTIPQTRFITKPSAKKTSTHRSPINTRSGLRL